MKALRTLLAAATTALALAACDGGTTISDGLHGLSLSNGVLTARADGQPDAVITAGGDLAIGGKAVTLTPAQHDLLKQYYASVVEVRQAGIETGKAGAALAKNAVGEVVSGLVHGDPDSISSKIDEHAKDVEDKALAICDSLESLQQTQDSIAASLPVFKPYAKLVVRGDSDCRHRSELRDADSHH